MSSQRPTYSDPLSTGSQAPQMGDSVLGHGGPSFGSEVGITRDDRFLNQANQINLTAEDRQEGYDADLVNLQPRTGEIDAAAAAIERTRSPPLGSSSSDAEKGLTDGSPRVNLAEGTYATRAKDSPRDGRTRRSSKRRPKQVWWQKPLFLLFLAALLVAIALGVGLGVGLGTKKKSTSAVATPLPSAASSSSSVVLPNGAGTTTAPVSIAQSTAAIGVSIQQSTTAVPASGTAGGDSGTARMARYRA